MCALIIHEGVTLTPCFHSQMGELLRSLGQNPTDSELRNLIDEVGSVTCAIHHAFCQQQRSSTLSQGDSERHTVWGLSAGMTQHVWHHGRWTATAVARWNLMSLWT